MLFHPVTIRVLLELLGCDAGAENSLGTNSIEDVAIGPSSAKSAPRSLRRRTLNAVGQYRVTLSLQ